MRIIMDVDTGIDDALALGLAWFHPEIELEAVLTVSGNVTVDLATRNTLRVLDWLGATRVPVVVGANKPISRPLRIGSGYHGADGLGRAAIPETGRTALHGAVEYLIERLRAEPGKLTLVCTGPLTNLALALSRELRVVDWVSKVVVMGGAIYPPGNVTPVAEFNIWVDPEAAAMVFAKPWQLTIVGLDVTNRVRFTADAWRAIEGLDSREAVLVREVSRFLFKTRGMDSFALHDPLAVAVALDPSLVDTAVGPVMVETKGEFTTGQTIFDLRPGAATLESRTQVCLGVDSGRFLDLFFSTLRLPRSAG